MGDEIRESLETADYFMVHVQQIERSGSHAPDVLQAYATCWLAAETRAARLAGGGR